MQIDNLAIESYFQQLQINICQTLEQLDGKKFTKDNWQKDNNKGYGRTHILESGNVFEQAGVNFSLVKGDNMPISASANRPELAGRSFQAMGLSLVLHAHNPFVPTVHMNVRFFIASHKNKNPIWWFGGGYDLTPYYGFDDDCISWHKNAKNACKGFGNDTYAKYKKWCDDYFYLKHRNEPRGIGGLFFDDLNQPDFVQCFAFVKSVANSFLTGYLPIINKRKNTTFNKKNQNWQRYRRGRYVEFNLIYDRGTLFGLQSGGRTKSILMSLPPTVHWRYQYKIEKKSAEEKLGQYYLQAKDWIKI